MDVVLAGLAGAVAGRGARVVLGRLRPPVRVTPGLPEALLAALWALAAVRPSPPWWLPVPLAVAWLAVVLTATDVRHRRLPNVLTAAAYPGAGVFLGAAAALGPGPGLAIRAVAAGAVLFAAHAVVHVAAPSHLGAGDVKLAGVLGAVLGAVSWPAVFLGPVLAAGLTAGVAATGLVARRRLSGVPTSRRPADLTAVPPGPPTVPHGPGLLAATLLVALFPGAGAFAG